MPLVPSASPTLPSDLVEELIRLDEEGRAARLTRHPELRSTAAVDELRQRSASQLRSDLGSARSAARAAWWLASRIGDAAARGRSCRTLANVLHVAGDYAAALNHYAAALELFNEAGSEKEGAITRSSALQTLAFMGEHQQAGEWAEAARQVFERTGDRLRLARLEANLANLLFRQDRFQDALDGYGQALDDLMRYGEPEDIAMVWSNLASCHISLNSFEEAVRAHQAARAIWHERGKQQMVLQVDYNIGHLYYLRGDHDRAIEIYRLARRRSRDVGDLHHEALCDLDEAEIYLELGLLPEAEQLAARAAAAFEKRGVGFEAAKATTFRALALSRQRRTRRALELLTSAQLRFAEERNLVWQGLAGLHRGAVLQQEGRRFEALQQASEAREIFLGAGLPAHVAMSELLLGRLHLEAGDLTAARDACAAALERLPAGERPGLESQGRFLLGRIEEAAGNREAALWALEEALGLLEREGTKASGAHYGVDFAEDRAAVYEALVRARLNGEAGSEDRAAAFALIEAAKSLRFADLVAPRVHTLPSSGGALGGLTDRVKALREDLNFLARRMVRQEVASPPGAASVDNLRRTLRQKEQQLASSLRQLRAVDREATSLHAAVAVDPATIQSVIPDDTVMLEYFFAEDTVYGAVLDSRRLSIVAATLVPRVQELRRRLRVQLARHRQDPGTLERAPDRWRRAVLPVLAGLYEELISPLEELLTGRRLVVVPHGLLHYLPFHAFSDGDGFLADRFAVSYAPSGSVYYFCRSRAGLPAEPPLLLGAWDGREEEGAVRREVEELAEVSTAARVLLGKEGRDRLTADPPVASSLVHFATRASFRPDNPMFSSLRLGGGGVTLFDLFGLKLACRLFALTGCGADLQGSASADELVGLARALLYSGARAVLLPLWNVDQRRQLDLLAGLYRRLDPAADLADLLQDAMLEMREGRPHPFDWAPFVLVGSTVPITESPSR